MELTQASHLVRIVSQAEETLETMRTELNQQITFNLKDFYMELSPNSPVIACNHLLAFLANAHSETSINTLEKFIRYHNNNSSLTLTFIEFSSLFISRENHLLAKMVLERDSLGAIPAYILNHARRIILRELYLHFQIQKNAIDCLDNFLEPLAQNGCIAVETFRKSLANNTEQEVTNFLRYINHQQNSPISADVVKNLFRTNQKSILSDYFNHSQSKKKMPARWEIHDCLGSPKAKDSKGLRRQLKSIDKHFVRMHLCDDPQKTLESQLASTQKHLREICELLRDMVWLDKQQENNRIKLSLCTDFYPVLFFKGFWTDTRNNMTPSSLRDYLASFGYVLEVEKVYNLFRRYASKTSGHLGFNSFCSILDPITNNYVHLDKNRQVRMLEDVSVETKRIFLEFLVASIQNQHKIAKAKKKANLIHHKAIRQALRFLDKDKDGMITMSQIRQCFQEQLDIAISKDELTLLWTRIGGKPSSKKIPINIIISNIVHMTK